MAPRPVVRRERNNDYSAVGTAGRRTGVTLPQGKLDEHGLEEITGLFSSPVKPSPKKSLPIAISKDVQNSTFEASEEMVGIDSSGLTPTRTLSARRSLGPPLRPPSRSASPKKSGIGGTPRRSNGIDISPSKALVEANQVENEENTPTPTPTPTPALSKVRKFLPSPEKRALKQITPNGDVNVLARSTERNVEKSVQYQPLTSNAQQTRPQRRGDSSSAQPDEYPVNPMGDDEVEDFISSIENSMQEESLGMEELDKTPQPEADSIVDSIEPASGTKGSSKAPVPRKPGRKRKSDDVESRDASLTAQTTKKARQKKPRTAQAKIISKIGPAVGQEFQADISPSESVINATQRLSIVDKDPKGQLSQRQQAELDQIIEKVRARPGKFKSLYVLKRKKSQVSGADDVRSGRATVKPLAYWTAEQCLHNEGATLAPGACIPLNPMKEASTGKKRADSDDDEAASLNDYHSDGNEEPWEREAGVFRGPTGVWDQTQLNCAPDELEETDLAFHPSAIQTHEVPGSGFKFAKLISTPFFGSGMLDLPPGTIKRPKNSRTMHMCFFVFKGRVKVRIGQEIDEENGEAFSLGKGGMFQVPRGNKYSVENVLEKPARLFFSQGCETMVDS